MAAKDIHKIKMIAFWGNPEEDFITRYAMHTDVLGITATTFYKHFTPAEIQDIEFESVEMRKKNSSRDRAKIYKALAKEAKSGNVSAAKEFFDRTEGKVIEKRQVTGKDEGPIETNHTLETGQGIQRVLHRLERATSGRQKDSDTGGDKE